MATKEEKQLRNQQMQQEILKKQNQIIQRYQKRLGAKPGQSSKKMIELQNFAESGKQVGSSHFLRLSPVVQEVTLQLNLSQLEIMDKYTKNPFRKLQISLSRMMMKRLKPSGTKKKGAKNTKGKKTTNQSFFTPKVISYIVAGIVVAGVAFYFLK